jgi:hypothetical protein
VAAPEDWFTIDTAPRDGTRLRVFAPAMGESVAWWLPAAEVWVEALGSGYMAPYQDWTHWRPDPDSSGPGPRMGDGG